MTNTMNHHTGNTRDRSRFLTKPLALTLLTAILGPNLVMSSGYDITYWEHKIDDLTSEYFMLKLTNPTPEMEEQGFIRHDDCEQKGISVFKVIEDTRSHLQRGHRLLTFVSTTGTTMAQRTGILAPDSNGYGHLTWLNNDPGFKCKRNWTMVTEEDAKLMEKMYAGIEAKVAAALDLEEPKEDSSREESSEEEESSSDESSMTPPIPEDPEVPSSPPRRGSTRILDVVVPPAKRRKTTRGRPIHFQIGDQSFVVGELMYSRVAGEDNDADTATNLYLGDYGVVMGRALDGVRLRVDFGRFGGVRDMRPNQITRNRLRRDLRRRHHDLQSEA